MAFMKATSLITLNKPKMAINQAYNTNAHFFCLNMLTQTQISNAAANIVNKESIVWFTPGMETLNMLFEIPITIGKNVIIVLIASLPVIAPTLDNIATISRKIKKKTIANNTGPLFALRFCINIMPSPMLSCPQLKHFVPLFMELSHFLHIMFQVSSSHFTPFLQLFFKVYRFPSLCFCAS
ncbi:MAG: hypothetical protein FWG34_02275 [Oscillospiraceae bacterium]|nr:hypothetical protein [Oscillospiraceae bacterium]